MREYQPLDRTDLSVIDRPRCPRCRQAHMLLSKLEAGPQGLEYRVFECEKCGRVHTIITSSDPMSSDAPGWLARDQQPPA